MSPLEISGLVKRFGEGAEAREVVRGLDLRLELDADGRLTELPLSSA